MTSRLAGLASKPAAETPSAAFFADSCNQPDQACQSISSPSIHPSSILGLWHLLSLDAPTVAVLWTIFTATVAHTNLSPVTPLAMALCVWMLYASDRLLDTRQLRYGPEHKIDSDLQLRHLFHDRYRTSFARALTLSAVALAALLPFLPSAAFHLYLAEGVALAGYFLLIHAPPLAPSSRTSRFLSTHRLPKELLVGPFFSAATFIPVVSRKPGLRPELVPLAILFAALCSLNCLYIYAWEHPRSREANWTTSLIGHLNILTSLFLAAAFFCFRTAHLPLNLRPYPLACGASGLLLVILHTGRKQFSPLGLRAAADAALLTPLAILPFLYRSHL